MRNLRGSILAEVWQRFGRCVFRSQLKTNSIPETGLPPHEVHTVYALILHLPKNASRCVGQRTCANEQGIAIVKVTRCPRKCYVSTMITDLYYGFAHRRRGGDASKRCLVRDRYLDECLVMDVVGCMCQCQWQLGFVDTRQIS